MTRLRSSLAAERRQTHELTIALRSAQRTTSAAGGGGRVLVQPELHRPPVYVGGAGCFTSRPASAPGM